MGADLYIPQATLNKLHDAHPEGTRHQAMIDIALSLLGNGMAKTSIFAELRARFDAEKTDKEIHDVIEWCASRNPTPSGFGASKASYRPMPRVRFTDPTQDKTKTPLEIASWWLSGATMTIPEFQSKSELPIPEDRTDALRLFLEMLYRGDDCLNVVCKFTETKGKANPSGPGKILTRDKWVEFIGQQIPENKAGAWFRPNPVKPEGSGASGAVTDSDVVACRFLLVESDTLPIESQLALFSRLKLPISAVTNSGGISAHALVLMGCDNAGEFDLKSKRLLGLLAQFGIDQCNKNPSRLSRLPSAIRSIGAAGDGLQRLLWVNPSKTRVTNEIIDELEQSLLVPAVEEKPFKKLMQESVNRFEELHANRGKLGVPTGFPKFDTVSGGLKPGGYTVVSGATGAGKSTIAMNMVNAALKAGHGVIIFSLEMSREDIADIFFSMNCGVDRNKFNTGEFTERDIMALSAGVMEMKNYPLWIDDDPAITMDSISRRVCSLKAESKIGLVVVDYAQLVVPDVPESNREQAVASVALGLRVLSRKANIPIVVLSQLNEDGKLRESRRLAHEAANVFRIERTNLTTPEITLFVDKGRKIPSHPIGLYLEAALCRVREVKYEPAQ